MAYWLRAVRQAFIYEYVHENFISIEEFKMAQTFNAPRPEDIIGVSTLVVGVGPGGNTSMLAYVITLLEANLSALVTSH